MINILMINILIALICSEKKKICFYLMPVKKEEIWAHGNDDECS